MLTLKLLRENPEFVIKKLAVKNFDAREIVGKINTLDSVILVVRTFIICRIIINTNFP